MAGVLAADPELSTIIAAFAPVSGAFYQSAGGDAKCRPASVDVAIRPARTNVPILEFHGAADTVIPYDGGADKGECLPAITHWVQTWAQSNGLDPDSNITSKVAGATNNDAKVFQFGTGDSLGLVTHIMVGEDIGHDWPSTEANEDNTIQGHGPASFNASSVIIDFFNNHSMPAQQASGSGTNGSQSVAGLVPAATNTAKSQSGSNATYGTALRAFRLELLVLLPSLALIHGFNFASLTL